ncbi:MAG: histidine kinase [Bacteroidales bacterium]|nr:histidine kinase [Bacteroidales bacterium]
MKLFRTQEKKENWLYLAVWVFAFAFLAGRIAAECIARKEQGIDMAAIWISWGGLLPFFLLFLVHNFLLAPMLLYDKKAGRYVAGVILALALFGTSIIVLHPGFDRRPMHELHHGPHHHEGQDGHGHPHHGGKHGPHHHGPHDHHLQQGDAPGEARPMSPQVLRILLGVLLVSANLGCKYYFHSTRERLRLQHLENENLQHHLDALRYQINPHFLMNTLNNIHALVDIEPEKAKTSIVELSKIMRHILYDCDRPSIPLSEEMDFLENYTALMRIRYSDEVSISLTRPEEFRDAEVPPLVFASIVENAFIHGELQGPESFIHISISIEEHAIVFRCANSRPEISRHQGGIGHANIRKRLELLYGERYTFHIEETPARYDVLLVIPTQIPEAA